MVDMLEDLKKNIEKLIALYESEKAENERLRSSLEEKIDKMIREIGRCISLLEKS